MPGRDATPDRSCRSGVVAGNPSEGCLLLAWVVRVAAVPIGVGGLMTGEGDDLARRLHAPLRRCVSPHSVIARVAVMILAIGRTVEIGLIESGIRTRGPTVHDDEFAVPAPLACERRAPKAHDRCRANSNSY